MKRNAHKIKTDKLERYDKIGKHDLIDIKNTR